ncbi:zinc ribbon domain-containing protein [Demequina zhanjiangensis]|uniref:Zinc ribbon domain-containing protein n=1 Tax=Demequina zhanjiangensis TaxID=3051659 RepID=A0ABT8G469_9MICO|nr:zinc ribbon domain-containing protein [Demequina sp. SYSU T00b26]MDN4473724.1 zinc ribbon domain-containing protein [Demequina sp. SYSU T00b26]
MGKRKPREVKWEPIIDQSIFDRLQRVFDDPARRTTISPGVKGGRYSLGGGLVKCGECGHTLTSYKRGTNRDNRAGLRCAKHTGGCGGITIDFDRLERYVFDTVAAVLNDSDRWKQRSTVQSAGDMSRELAELDARKQELDEQARRATNAYVEGLMPESELRVHSIRIREEWTEVDRKVADLLGSSQLDRAMSKGLTWETWTSWTPERRLNFLRLALDSIVVSRWPTDVPKGLPTRRTETAEEHQARFELGQREALIKRVQINCKD